MRIEDQRVVRTFINEIRRESDRGLALIGAAFIDQKLAETLQAFFFKNSSELLFGRNAPLGSFSARIETCHSLALIEEVERNDCNYIRRIRNEFAHKVISTSFEQEKIRDLCANLKTPLPEPTLVSKTPARFRFENAVIMMALRLYYRPEYVAREKRSPKDWIDPDWIRWRRTSEEPPPEGQVVLGVIMPGFNDSGIEN